MKNCIPLIRADQQSKETFAVQKTSSILTILTPTLSQIKILVLTMLLIASLRLNATNQNQIHQRQRTYLDSQTHCLVFRSAFRRIRIVQKRLQQKNSSEKKKFDWSNFQAKEKIIAKLHDSLSSILKMSLREIHSKWAGQYKYHNFVANYKRLQKKIETELSKPMIDSNNQNHTSLSPAIYMKKPPSNKMSQKRL